MVEVEESKLIQGLIQARAVPAVQKTKLSTMRSAKPDAAIFAFEGIDDKRVYYFWIKQLAPNLQYEPYICHGKEKVLELKKIVDRDLNDLKDTVFFFVDRDFDELRGTAPCSSIFMTETYSFENHLVTKEVLEDLLKVELHCHSEPSCRSEIIDLFEKLYGEFLEVTQSLNFRIFMARRCEIEQLEALPTRINQIATVGLNGVSSGKGRLEELVVLSREPTEDEIREHASDFNSLDPETRYRGKFALLFFNRLLELLIAERNSSDSKYFVGLEREGYVARGPISLDSMASKSQIPAGLDPFLQSILDKSKTWALLQQK